MNWRSQTTGSSPQSTFYGFSDFIFLAAAAFCAGKMFTVWPYAWWWSTYGRPDWRHLLKKPALGGTLMISSHSEAVGYLGFSSLLWCVLSFLSSWRNITIQFWLCMQTVFSWFHQPAFLEKGVFKVTFHFIPIWSKPIHIQTIVLLLLDIC